MENERIEEKTERRQRRRCRIDIPALMERVVERLQPIGKADAPGRDCSPRVAEEAPETGEAAADSGQAVMVVEAPLPSLTTQDEALAEWVVRLVRDDTPIAQWPDAVREQALAGTAALELAVAHAEKALQGCDPAIAAGILGTFLSRIPLREDPDILERSVVLDVRSMSKMPGDMLRLSADRMSAQWGGGLRWRPGAGDFRRAVREELAERQEKARLLKDGLNRVRTEQALAADGRLAAFRKREAARRAAEWEAIRVAENLAKKPS
ncbi:hypothetical protein GGE65_007739 [Skermanella aerolata]|uniref:hypothetical protein n=1 Tax=Skermanella aerolata TaxID=393310 RepID=UPI003D199EDF